MGQHSQYGLLKQRRFLPFFVTQFLGAFNDNVYKSALVILVAFHAASLSRLDTYTLSNPAQALFILPFFLLSATAGQIADKFEKSFLIRLVKLAEIAIIGHGRGRALLARSLPAARRPVPDGIAFHRSRPREVRLGAATHGCATAAAVRALTSATARNANLNDSHVREKMYTLSVGHAFVRFLQDSTRFELTCIKCGPFA